MKKSCKNCKADDYRAKNGCSLGYRTSPSKENCMYPNIPIEECCKPMSNKAYYTAWKIRQGIILSRSIE